MFSLQAAYAAPLILLAQTRQADRDKGRLNRLGWIFEDGLPTLSEEVLAEAPGVQVFVLVGEPHLLHKWKPFQKPRQLGGLAGFEDGDRLAPVAGHLLQPSNLVLVTPADWALFDQVRDYFAQDIFMLQLPSQPARHRLH